MPPISSWVNKCFLQNFLPIFVRYRPQNVRYGENASERKQMRTAALNLSQKHILQRANSSECKKFIPGRSLQLHVSPFVGESLGERSQDHSKGSFALCNCYFIACDAVINV
jgi:hypothetical protein